MLSEPLTKLGVEGVNVIGFVSARLGLGNAARHTIASLVSARFPVSVVDITLPDGRSGADQTWAHLNIRDTSALPHKINIVHLNPLEAAQVRAQFPQWFAGAANGIVPFWELSQPPQDWIAHISAFDVLLAPTHHIASVFRNLVAIPVRHYPLAVGQLNASPGREPFGIPERKFAVACAFDTDSGLNRKNSLGMIRAFDLAFRDDPDVVMVMKTNGLTKHPELEFLLSQLPSDRYIVNRDYLPYEEVLNLYASCDAFMSLHRAEGLGLGLLEAMSLGKPVIATGWSGNLDFMDESSAALVRFSLVPVVDPHPEYSQSRFRDTAFWAEVDIAHAVTKLRRVKQDAHYRDAIALEGKRRAHARSAEFSDRPIALMRAILDEKRSHLRGSY